MKRYLLLLILLQGCSSLSLDDATKIGDRYYHPRTAQCEHGITRDYWLTYQGIHKHKGETYIQPVGFSPVVVMPQRRDYRSFNMILSHEIEYHVCGDKHHD